ncbi:LysR family transcriptional regulator [Mycolicibacterium chlorophenolicum]|uniref:HTH-type transcriptional regulator CysL n=1 Tax=Mycolicibacterium chlorophenolicum TaxID=37916 RepID=A0A0J6WIU1_9MYCO|nr:LysR family transcriptional regulator [Mycolicibacterium chlorophenolicum]KMO82499.1 HTH-type transcriptional regulator CysL [Mycolicibacterium chlorophenolicum]
MPDLVALEVLLSIARTGSLSAAGRQCGMTQQAVSARVAALESQTGVRMVRRSRTGSELTPAGVVTAQWADRLLGVAHEVDAGLATLRADSKSRVRVHASLTIAELLMPRWLVTLRTALERHGDAVPEVILTAENSEHVIAAVLHGDADVGFIESPGTARGLRSRIVAYDELVLVVPAAHRWTRRSQPIEIAELAQTALVTREPGSGTRDYLTTALAATGGGVVQAAPVLELSTAAAVRAAVLAGAGPAVMSRLAVSDDLSLGRMRAIPVRELDLHRSLRAIWVGSRTPPAGAVRDLLGHITSVQRSASASASAPAPARTRH